MFSRWWAWACTLLLVNFNTQRTSAFHLVLNWTCTHHTLVFRKLRVCGLRNLEAQFISLLLELALSLRFLSLLRKILLGVGPPEVVFTLSGIFGSKWGGEFQVELLVPPMLWPVLIPFCPCRFLLTIIQCPYCPSLFVSSHALCVSILCKFQWFS